MGDYSELKVAIEYILNQGALEREFIEDADALDAAWAVYEALGPTDILALIAKNERLTKLLERMVDQYVPLAELEGVPGWSRVVELVEVVAQRDQLKAENERLESEAVYAAAGFDAAREQIARLKVESDRLSAELDCPFRLARHSKRLVDQLRAEVAGLRTGYEAYEQVNAELKAENEELRILLLEAADEIDTWGAYASDYFQEKYDLAGCVAKFHAAALGKGERS